jgi:hypothetical protein
VFLPGFSTANAVTTISGLCVGMDVVKTNIERIGGAVELVSRPLEGTTIRSNGKAPAFAGVSLTRGRSYPSPS